MEPENKIIGSGKQESLKIKEADNVPLNAKLRIKELLSLPLKEKQAFVPPVGLQLTIGPFVYEVSVTNVSRLRFTATLVDVNIKKKEEEKKPDIKVVSK
ncbi:MAG: hypothetical protein JRI53_09795 [Deltaproteobacteria bacterium]|nr:hypothetical protein [Deltaproteobacteria bacterium]MBW2178780.1 hypothetical protein [Deltaproteobacteria bacterium]MBW2363491.1 hypothetical protein [Deltaproteobacteria bacterium]